MLKKMLRDGWDFQMVKIVKNIMSGNTSPCYVRDTCARAIQLCSVRTRENGEIQSCTRVGGNDASTQSTQQVTR